MSSHSAMNHAGHLLSPRELCVRWAMSDSTLRKWRVTGNGPSYIKLGPGRNSRVMYHLKDVETFEAANVFPTKGGV